MRRLVTVVIFALATGTLAQTADKLPHLTPAPLNTFTLPAGTHVLMTLTSPLHTTSARAGAGVYLETSWPVIQDGQVVIPALIFPDNRVVTIAGSLQSLPGNEKIRPQDKEGTLEPVDQIDRDVYRVASGTIAGGLGGALTRTATGAGIGMAIGAGLGLAKVLFTRGDEIHLPEGTKVEMVLEKPLTLAPR